MKKCNECKKKLGFFEGYRHPTLGKENLLCSPCFDKVQQSVDQWREFVFSNSFNPESFIKTTSFNWNFLFSKILETRKPLAITEKKKSTYITQNKLRDEMNLIQLHYENKETIV
jgi:hypothetical protein